MLVQIVAHLFPCLLFLTIFFVVLVVVKTESNSLFGKSNLANSADSYSVNLIIDYNFSLSSVYIITLLSTLRPSR